MQELETLYYNTEIAKKIHDVKCHRSNPFHRTMFPLIHSKQMGIEIACTGIKSGQFEYSSFSKTNRKTTDASHMTIFIKIHPSLIARRLHFQNFQSFHNFNSIEDESVSYFVYDENAIKDIFETLNDNYSHLKSIVPFLCMLVRDWMDLDAKIRIDSAIKIQRSTLQQLYRPSRYFYLSQAKSLVYFKPPYDDLD